MGRFLAGLLAVALITSGVSLATVRADAATLSGPSGTRAVGNSYSILWVKPPKPRGIVEVWVAGKRAVLRDGGYWEVVLTGPQRNRASRLVQVNRKHWASASIIHFREVPW